MSTCDPSTESHRNEDGLCALDGEDWPCSVVPSTEPGYEAAWAYGQAQRAGWDNWPEDRGKGLQVYCRTLRSEEISD